MPHRPVSLRAPKGSVAAAVIREGIDALIAEAQRSSDLPVEFPAEVVALAEQEAATWRERAGAHVDMTGVPFVTLDPASSTDLDQAMHLTKHEDGSGYRVLYAIADVPLFVELGSALDAEARRRGATVYLPDRPNVTVTAASMQGRVASDFPYELPAGSSPRRRQTFQLGAGSARLEMESFGGTLRLRKRDGTTPARDDE